MNTYSKNSQCTGAARACNEIMPAEAAGSRPAHREVDPDDDDGGGEDAEEEPVHEQPKYGTSAHAG